MAILVVSNVAAALIWTRYIFTNLVTSTIICSTFLDIYALKHKLLPLLTSPLPSLPFNRLNKIASEDRRSFKSESFFFYDQWSVMKINRKGSLLLNISKNVIFMWANKKIIVQETDQFYANLILWDPRRIDLGEGNRTLQICSRIPLSGVYLATCHLETSRSTRRSPNTLNLWWTFLKLPTDKAYIGSHSPELNPS